MARKTYTPEFKAHLIALVRQGRLPEQLAREFEPSAATIRNWVAEAEKADKGGVIDKDAEIRALKKQVARLEEEREILKKAAAWFAKETESTPRRGSRS